MDIEHLEDAVTISSNLYAHWVCLSTSFVYLATDLILEAITLDLGWGSSCCLYSTQVFLKKTELYFHMRELSQNLKNRAPGPCFNWAHFKVYASTCVLVGKRFDNILMTSLRHL